MKNNNLFIVSGSNGWLSSVFFEKLKSLEQKVVKISNSKEWNIIGNIDQNKYDKILLIHNGFVDHRNSKLSDGEYEEILGSNFEIFKNFLLNYKITGLFYPSTGRIYFNNESKKLQIYSKQKILEENKIKELAEIKNFSYIISRIFSPIGPINNHNVENSLNSILKDSIIHRKIKINSKTNDIHSISIIENLVALILKLFLLENKNKLEYVFDVVDINISILELSNTISKLIFKGGLHIDHNFSSEEKINTYVGNDEVYKKLKKEYLVDFYNLETYLQKLLTL